MAQSKPFIKDANIPSESKPRQTFPISVTIEHQGPDPWFSDGDCQPTATTLTGWKTPIKVYINGKVVKETTECIPNNNSKTVKLPISLPSAGSHRVKVEVYSIGGNAYLPGVKKEVNDDITQTIEASQDAPDPSNSSGVMDFLNDIAAKLGTSANMVALGIALGVGVFLVI